jgi:hypothetical protein
MVCRSTKKAVFNNQPLFNPFNFGMVLPANIINNFRCQSFYSLSCFSKNSYCSCLKSSTMMPECWHWNSPSLSPYPIVANPHTQSRRWDLGDAQTRSNTIEWRSSHNLTGVRKTTEANHCYGKFLVSGCCGRTTQGMTSFVLLVKFPTCR